MDFGKLQVLADSFVAKRVDRGRTPPKDNWVFTAHGKVRLGSAAAGRSYLTVPVELGVPVPGSTAATFNIDSAITFPGFGGLPETFERRVFTLNKLCRLNGSFEGQVPIHDSSALKVARGSAQLYADGAKLPGIKGQGQLGLTLPENADLRLDLSFAASPGSWPPMRTANPRSPCSSGPRKPRASTWSSPRTFRPRAS